MQGKSDFELEQEERQKQHHAAKEAILQEQKELFKIPKHLDVDKLKDDRRLIDHTNWISGLIEVQVSQERKIGEPHSVLRNEHGRLCIASKDGHALSVGFKAGKGLKKELVKAFRIHDDFLGTAPEHGLSSHVLL